MNILLIFFAIPLAVIILAAILETFIHCPFKVAGIFFAIFIVVAFALGGDAIYIVAAIIYTLLAFIIAALVRIIINRRCNNSCDDMCGFCKDECLDCNLNNTFSVNNGGSNNLRTFNNLNSINSLNTINPLSNFNNLNNFNCNNFNQDIETINSASRENSNTFNSNNMCRRGR